MEARSNQSIIKLLRWVKLPRISLPGLSGADKDTVEKILPIDRRSYSNVGLLNIVLALLSTGSWLVFSIIVKINIIWIAGIAILLFVAVIYLQKWKTGSLIDKDTLESRVSFFCLELVICLIVAAGPPFLELNKRFSGDRIRIRGIDSLLASDTTEIGREGSQIELMRGDLLSGKIGASDTILTYKSIPHFIALNDSLAKLVNQKINTVPPRPFKDSAIDEIKTIKAGISAANRALFRFSIDDTLRLGHSAKDQTDLAKAMLDSVLAVPSSDQSTDYFDYENFDKGNESLSESLDILTFYADSSTIYWIIIIAIFTISILFTFCYYIYAVIRSVKNDFYHQLLDEKRKFESEALNLEREKIAAEIKLKREIENTNAIFEKVTAAEGKLTVNKPASDAIDDKDVATLYDAALKAEQLKDFQGALSFVNKAITLDDEKYSADNNYSLNPILHQLKASLLGDLKKSDEARTSLDRFVELNNERKYQLNLGKEILLERLEAENMPFYGTFTWSLKPGINILLGKNGYGKSHLLGLLIALLYEEKTKIRDWIAPTSDASSKAKLYILSDHPRNEDKIASLKMELEALYSYRNKINDVTDEQENRNSTESGGYISQGDLPDFQEIDNLDDEIINKKAELDTEMRRILANKEGVTGNIGRVPVLAIPDVRFIDKSETTISSGRTTIQDLRRDGGTDYLFSMSFSEIIKKGLFIVAQNNSTDFSKEPYNLIERVISSLADYGTPRQDKAGGRQSYFKFSRIETVSATGDYKFFVRSEENNADFELQKVSQGTFSVLAICLMVFRFLSELRPSSTNVLFEKAIVLIDEIDEHLHPSWEQKIIGILRREFPNVQFIITAHSPLVVAGCLEGEVAVLRRTENSFLIEQIRSDFIGMSSEDIYKKLFEIEDRDEQYVRYSVYSDDAIAELESKKDELINKKQTGNVFPKEDENKLDEIYDELNKVDIAKRAMARKTEWQFEKGAQKLLKMEIEKLRKEISILRGSAMS